MRYPERPAALLASASALLPGLGQLIAGRRRRALPLLTLSIVTTAALVGYVAAHSRRGLVGNIVTDRGFEVILAANALVFLFRLFAVIDAYRLGAGRKFLSSHGVLLIAVIFVAAPQAVLAYADVTAWQTLDSVFQAQAPNPGLPFATYPHSHPSFGHHPPAPPLLPWQKSRRLSILLLGGDAGPGRAGLRTDSMIVATINTNSGKMALMSLPRNLYGVPLPAASAKVLGSQFPDLLNALYPRINEDKGAFPGIPGKDPGAEELKMTIANLLGMRIDYYALVDLCGFVKMTDALGGVNMYVQENINDHISPPCPNDKPYYVNWRPGYKHLNGIQALTYVRVRHQTSDYDRIRRQRCYLAAMTDQTSPTKILQHFTEINSILQHYLETDIPRSELPTMINLLGTLNKKRILSISFGPTFYETLPGNYPVIPNIQEAVREIIAGQKPTAANGVRPRQHNPTGSGTVAQGICGPHPSA